jgi:hypothetical protein
MSDTLGDKAFELTERRERAISKPIEVAKAIEPLLRDLNHNNTADRLAAALGEIDAIDAENRAFVHDNASAIAFALLGRMPGQR